MIKYKASQRKINQVILIRMMKVLNQEVVIKKKMYRYRKILIKGILQHSS